MYCSPSIYTSNADTEMNDHIYQSAAVITCHQGFKFSDGTKSRSVVCQKDGTWSINQVHCHGKIKWFDFFRMKYKIMVLICRSLIAHDIILQYTIQLLYNNMGFHFFKGDHGGAVVKHSPPTSYVCGSNPEPYVGNLVDAY